MRTGHLFAGIDGIGLGLEPNGFVPAWFSEYESAPSRVLAHHYPDVPNHGDITAIDWTKVEPVDVLTGGFPCQDLSYAGKGAGIKEGTRSGLWFEYVRAIRALRPRIVIVENVAALLTRGVGIVLGDLAACGFDASWSVLRASDVGAAHRRERLFIVAVATDSDVRRHLHGQPGKHPAEARVHALGHVAPAGDQNAADSHDSGRVERGRRESTASEHATSERGREAAQDADEQPREQWRVSASGQAEGGRTRSELAGRGGASTTDLDGGGRQERGEPDSGTFGPGLEASRPGDAGGRSKAAPDAIDGRRNGRKGVPRGLLLAHGEETGRDQDTGHLGPRDPAEWGEFAPAIRRWEHVTGRPAPAPTVDGRLSADFTEWHMGFPEGWTSMLSRNERLKALGNAVVPQCAEVIGRWALELVDREVAA